MGKEYGEYKSRMVFIYPNGLTPHTFFYPAEYKAFRKRKPTPTMVSII